MACEATLVAGCWSSALLLITVIQWPHNVRYWRPGRRVPPPPDRLRSPPCSLSAGSQCCCPLVLPIIAQRPGAQAAAVQVSAAAIANLCSSLAAQDQPQAPAIQQFRILLRRDDSFEPLRSLVQAIDRLRAVFELMLQYGEESLQGSCSDGTISGFEIDSVLGRTFGTRPTVGGCCRERPLSGAAAGVPDVQGVRRRSLNMPTALALTGGGGGSWDDARNQNQFQSICAAKHPGSHGSGCDSWGESYWQVAALVELTAKVQYHPLAVHLSYCCSAPEPLLQCT